MAASSSPSGDLANLGDVPFEHPLLTRTGQFSGRVVSVETDRVDVDGHVVDRDVVRHPGAAAVVALDEHRRVLLVRQYRHPVSHLLWEIPGGLLDQPDEEPAECARRELLEEGGYVAGSVQPLLRLYVTPGGSDEVIHIFMATEIEAAPGGRVLTGEAEEADMPHMWIDLDAAVRAVMDGRIGNGITASALLAASHIWNAGHAEGKH
jgi:8-oxo-dGDP phosphatase